MTTINNRAPEPLHQLVNNSEQEDQDPKLFSYFPRVFIKRRASNPSSSSSRPAMENVACGCEEAELKKQSNFALQWKELLGSIDSSRNALQARLRELQQRLESEQGSIQARQQKIQGREKEMEAKVSNLKSELHKVESLAGEKGREVGAKEERLLEVGKLVEEKKRDCNFINECIKERSEKLSKCNEEIELRREQLNAIRGSIEEARRVFDLKQEQVKAVQKQVEECHQKCGEVGSMEKTVTRLQGVVNKYCEDIDAKRRVLNSICEDIDVKWRDLSSLDEQITAARNSLGECNEEIKLKNDQLGLIQKSMVECTNTLESREKLIREMEAKVKDFGLLKKSMEEWSCKLGVKERELEGWVEKLEFREKQVESKYEEVNLIDKRVSECLNEVQLKEQHFGTLGKMIQERKDHMDSHEKSLQERCRGLEMRESKLEEQGKEIELKQKHFLSAINSIEEDIQQLKSTFVHSEVETDRDLLCTPAIKNKGKLQRPPTELSSENHTVENKMLLALQLSSDPEKLVLKLMQISFANCWRKGDVGFNPDFMKKNISMLKDLREVLLHAGTHVRDDAIRLAVQWKEKMRAETENSLEILCFLHFVTTYGFISTLSEDEIFKFLEMICQHKQAREVCQTLGFADKIPDLVQALIERKRLIMAVGFICSFNLNEKFPPVLLLKRCVEDARKSNSTICRSLDEKVEVVDNHIAILRDVIQCIKDNKLESEFSSKDVETEIVGLQKLKENRRCSVPSEVEQQEKVKRKRHGESKECTIPLELLRRSKRLQID